MIAANATDIVSIQGAIGNLQNQNILLQAAIVANSGDIDTLQAQVAANDAAITSLQNALLASGLLIGTNFNSFATHLCVRVKFIKLQ